MTKIDVLEQARVEFRAARQWYRELNPVAAKRFAMEVKSAIAAIRRNPDWYARWNDSYRFYLLKRFPFFVAYRHTKELIVIVAVRHTSRDQDAWKGR
jgi:plasmid stabilization system protein ParE